MIKSGAADGEILHCERAIATDKVLWNIGEVDACSVLVSPSRNKPSYQLEVLEFPLSRELGPCVSIMDTEIQLQFGLISSSTLVGNDWLAPWGWIFVTYTVSYTCMHFYTLEHYYIGGLLSLTKTLFSGHALENLKEEPTPL